MTTRRVSGRSTCGVSRHLTALSYVVGAAVSCHMDDGGTRTRDPRIRLRAGLETGCRSYATPQGDGTTPERVSLHADAA
jgi:hypothetical protein